MATRLVPVESTNPTLPAVVTTAMTATNTEAMAGTSTTKWVSPANREAASSVIDPRKYGLSPSASASVNRAALQSAINEATGAANPITNLRYCNRAIAIPAGTYLIDAPLTVASALGLTIRGVGLVVIQASANMTNVFDINGAAYSNFGDLTISGSSGVQVTDVIHTYWDPAGSFFPNTSNHYHDITIRNIDFVTGIRAGKVGAGIANLQVDDDVYEHIIIDGAWTTGNVTRYQGGLHLGAGTFGNNLTHNVYHLRSASIRYGLRNDNTQVAVFGSGFAGGEAAIFQGVAGHATYQGIRVETHERLMITASGNTYPPQITLSDIVFVANSLHADGRWIKMELPGTLKLNNVKVTTVANGITPKIYINPGTGRARHLVDGLAVTGVDSPYAVVDLFEFSGNNATVSGRSYVRQDPAGSALDTQDFELPGVEAQIGTAYTFVHNDAFKLVTLSNVAAITATIPTNTTIPFPVGARLRLQQTGAGAVTVVGAGGVTVAGTLKSFGQNKMMTATKTAINTWTVDGGTSINNDTGIGFEAQKTLTSGADNTAVGASAQAGLTSGGSNTAIGSDAHRFLSTSNFNTAVGNATQIQVSGGSNTAVGAIAHYGLTSGANNTAIGYQAGYAPNGVAANATTTASRQTSVGQESGQGSAVQSADITTIGYRAIAVGAGATALGSGASAPFAGSVALGMSTAATVADQVAIGTRDLEIFGASTKGIVMASPDGTRYRLRIANGGIVSITAA